MFEVRKLDKANKANKVAMRTKEYKLDENNNIDFSNQTTIKFTSINAKNDIIDVFLEYTNDEKNKTFKKVESLNGDLNYHRIELKDEINEELTFDIVNNISLTINIKVENKFQGRRSSITDRLNVFNKSNNTTQAPKNNNNIPKKFAFNILEPKQKKVEKKRRNKKFKK